MANYLKYTKLILKKMSFCPILLNKEYQKCIVLLSVQEYKLLNRWLRRQHFSEKLKVKLS